MASCLATCFCANYLRLVNTVLMLLGLLMLSLMLYVIGSGAMSNSSMESFSSLTNTDGAKWGAVVAGLLLIIASAIGCKFASSKERCWGCAYLCIVLLALLLQVLLVIIATGGSLSDINKIRDDLVSAEQDQVVNTKVDNAKSLAMRHTFKTFSDQFASKKCALDQTQAQVLMARPRPEELPWLRRGTARMAIRRLGSTEQKCVPAQRSVTCAADEEDRYGGAMTKYCQGEGNGDTFGKVCPGCVDSFWEVWNLDQTFSEGQKADRDALRSQFEGDAGAVYCRCLSTFVALADAHYPTIKMAGLTFLFLEVLVLGSTIYLMLTGPEEHHNMDSSASQIEMTAAGSRTTFETVQCPDGCKPGDPIMVTTRAGQNVAVTVPEGVWPGDMFNVEITV